MFQANPPSERGLTLLEVAIALAIVGIAVGTIASLVGTADGLSAESRVRLRAVAENRAGLGAIAKVLRGIDLSTLDGFDDGGEALNPSFRTVVGSDEIGNLHGDVEELRWIASGQTIPGVGSAGTVHLMRGGVQHSVAKRVVSGGFRLTQLGSTLVVRLRTYYTTCEGRVVVVDGRTAAAARN